MAGWEQFAANLVTGGFKGYDYVKDQQRLAAEEKRREEMQAWARENQDWVRNERLREQALRHDTANNPMFGTDIGYQGSALGLQQDKDIAPENAQAFSRYFAGKDPAYVQQYYDALPDRARYMPQTPPKFDGRMAAGVPATPAAPAPSSALGVLEPGRATFERPMHNDDDYSLRNIGATGGPKPRTYSVPDTDALTRQATMLAPKKLKGEARQKWVAERVKQMQATQGVVRQAAERHGLDPDWYAALAWQESRYRTDALSPKNAAGVAQVLPTTAAEVLGIEPTKANLAALKGRLLSDPHFAADVGAQYLKRMLVQFDNDIVKATAAYNTGPGAVRAAMKKGRNIPNYRETKDYVAKIMPGGGAIGGATALASIDPKKNVVTPEERAAYRARSIHANVGDNPYPDVHMGQVGDEFEPTPFTPTNTALAGMVPEDMWMPAPRGPERPDMVPGTRDPMPMQPGRPSPTLLVGTTPAPQAPSALGAGQPDRVTPMPGRPMPGAPTYAGPTPTPQAVRPPTRIAAAPGPAERVLSAVTPSAVAAPQLSPTPGAPRLADAGTVPAPQQSGSILNASSRDDAWAQATTPTPSIDPARVRGPGAVEAPRTTEPVRPAAAAPAAPARPAGNPLDPTGIASVPNIAWGIVQNPQPYTRPAPTPPAAQPAEAPSALDRDRLPVPGGLRPSPTVRGPGVPVDPRKTGGPGSAVMPLQPGREDLTPGVSAPPPVAIAPSPAVPRATAPTPAAPRVAEAGRVPAPQAPDERVPDQPGRPEYAGFTGYSDQTSAYQPPKGPQRIDTRRELQSRKVTEADWARNQARIYAKHGKSEEAVRYLTHAAQVQKRDADNALFDIWRNVRSGGVNTQQLNSALRNWYEQYIPDGRTGSVMVSEDGIQVMTHDPENPGDMQVLPPKGKFKSIDDLFENILGMTDMNSWFELQKVQLMRQDKESMDKYRGVLTENARLQQQITKGNIEKTQDLEREYEALMQMYANGQGDTPEFRKRMELFQLRSTGRMPGGKTSTPGTDPKVKVEGYEGDYYRSPEGRVYRYGPDGSQVPPGFDAATAKQMYDQAVEAGYPEIQVVPAFQMGQPYGFMINGVTYDNLAEAIENAKAARAQGAHTDMWYKRGLEGYGKAKPKDSGTDVMIQWWGS